MKIKILTLSGITYEKEVRNGDTVEKLKSELARSQQVGIDQIRLLFNGKPMQNNQWSVFRYDVKEGDTIQLVIDDKVTIKVTVEMPDGKSQEFTVNSNEEVNNLKLKIQQATGFQVDTIQLFFQRRPIDGGKLRHYDIKDGSRVTLQLTNIQVFVRTIDGKTLTVDISHSETVDGLKSKLYDRTRVPVAQQRLTCNGKPLQSGRLSELNVRCGNTIEMNGRLRGG